MQFRSPFSDDILGIFELCNRPLKPEYHQNIRQRQEKFRTPMDPIHIRQGFIQHCLGINSGGNRHPNKDQGHVEANQGQSRHVGRSRQKPKEAQVGKQR